MSDHYTKESDAGPIPDGPNAVEEARKQHHLATADPEPERGDGTLTGPAHEKKYGLERAAGSAEHWVDRGVHPIENRALGDGEKVQTASGSKAPETTSAPRASDKK